MKVSNIRKNYYDKLENVISKIRDFSELHYDEIYSLEKFFQTAGDLVERECPEFFGKYQEIIGVVNQYIDEEKKIAYSERICAEDLNDIVARNVVLTKTREAADSKRNQFQRQKSDLERLRVKLQEDLKTKNGANQTKINSDINRATDECVTTREELIGRLKYLSQSKTRDDLYRSRKLRSSFCTLGVITSQSLTKELELLERIKNLCDVNPDTLDQMVNSPAAAMSSESSPPVRETVFSNTNCVEQPNITNKNDNYNQDGFMQYNQPVDTQYDQAVHLGFNQEGFDQYNQGAYVQYNPENYNFNNGFQNDGNYFNPSQEEMQQQTNFIGHNDDMFGSQKKEENPFDEP